MAKFANAGELRTLVRFIKTNRTKDSDGYPIETEVEVLKTRVKWVNAHGTDVFTAMQLQLREPATITMRYHPHINPKLTIIKGSDKYEIISIDNVEEKNQWMEIKVQRRTEAV